MLMNLIKPNLVRYLLGGSLILTGILGVLLAISRSELTSAKEVIRDLEGWQGAMVTTVALASGNEAVTKDTAHLQVQVMGDTVKSLHTAIDKQNAEIVVLGEKARQAKIDAQAEIKRRSAGIETATKARDRITTTGEWSVRELQDQAYEAGL